MDVVGLRIITFLVSATKSTNLGSLLILDLLWLTNNLIPTHFIKQITSLSVYLFDKENFTYFLSEQKHKMFSINIPNFVHSYVKDMLWFYTRLYRLERWIWENDYNTETELYSWYVFLLFRYASLDSLYARIIFIFSNILQ